MESYLFQTLVDNPVMLCFLFLLKLVPTFVNLGLFISFIRISSVYKTQVGREYRTSQEDYVDAIHNRIFHSNC